MKISTAQEVRPSWYKSYPTVSRLREVNSSLLIRDSKDWGLSEEVKTSESRDSGYRRTDEQGSLLIETDSEMM